MGSREESPIQSQSNLDVRVIRAAHSGVPKPPSEITGYTKVHALNSVGSFPDIPLRKCLHCRMAPREVPFLAVSAAKLGSRRMTIMDRRISAPERYDRGRSLPEAKIYEKALADFQCATGDSEYCGRAYRELGLCLRAMVARRKRLRHSGIPSSSLPENEYLSVLLLGQTLEESGRPSDALRTCNAIREHDPAF